MPPISKFSDNTLGQIGAILGDTQRGFTGGEIGSLLAQAGISDPAPDTTKRYRLHRALAARQDQDGCANNVVAFIRIAMDPSRYVREVDVFNDRRRDLNIALALSGMHLAENGEVVRVSRATTLNEARARAATLRSKLLDRQVHAEVLRFCKEELLADNYFHAVFEATKSVAERIRSLTGLTGDGGELVDQALNVQNPMLAINRLSTDTEKSEQKGFGNLIKGIFGMFRNVTAHAPRLTWEVTEPDALDLMSMLSLVHRRLDSCAVVRRSS